MKYVVVLGDGMADNRLSALGGKTPLQVANKPFIDWLAKNGEVGLCKTVPNDMKPGSDVANLSVLGYDVQKNYTGRSPLEAASIGIELKDTDVTARVNLVTLSEEQEFEDKSLIDYSAGEISTKEATELIEFLQANLGDSKNAFYAGVSYRHCLVVDKGELVNDLAPAHDITGRKIKEYLPKNVIGQNYLSLMKRAYELLKNHPINAERVKRGKNPANGIWIWGEGTKPSLENYFKMTGLRAGMISAVDLLKGIAILSDMRIIEVEGATGNYDTDFMGKAKACLDALLGGLDFVYVHIEAADECGHHGDVKNKVYSIEQIDKVAKYIANGLTDAGEQYVMLVCPDHPTPIDTLTHDKSPVPYVIFNSEKLKDSGVSRYDEFTAASTGVFVEKGYELIKRLTRI